MAAKRGERLLPGQGGIDLIGLSGIVVGPLAAALFITGWQILSEQRGVAAASVRARGHRSTQGVESARRGESAVGARGRAVGSG